MIDFVPVKRIYSLLFFVIIFSILGYLWYNDAGDNMGSFLRSTEHHSTIDPGAHLDSDETGDELELGNHLQATPAVSQKLWYDISNETMMWHVAHYEHRYFAYKAPAAIILNFFHYHLSPFPPLHLKVRLGRAAAICLEGHTIPFISTKGEDNFSYLVVFKLFNNTSIPDYAHLYENDPTCSSPPIIENIPIYYKHNETQIEFATCLYKGITETKDVISLDLISWVEINRAIGVQHITMYDQELSSKTLEMLYKYRQEGFIELLDWKIPNPEKTVYTGQIGTIQDCFYRYVRRAKYILFIDLDELIIPRRHNNLSDMMRYLNRKGVTQYRFYNSFWHLTNKQALGEYVPSQNESIPVHFQRTNRTKNCPPTIRYKNIIKAEGAIRIGIHHLYKMKDGETMYKVPENIGLMHHYRRPDYAKDEEQIEDMIMSKYAPKVMSRLKQME